jgi:hypothetical protein
MKQKNNVIPFPTGGRGAASTTSSPSKISWETHPLSGLVFCCNCDLEMARRIGAAPGHKPSKYLYCYGCGLYIAYGIAEESVLKMLEDVSISKANLRKLMKASFDIKEAELLSQLYKDAYQDQHTTTLAQMYSLCDVSVEMKNRFLNFFLDIIDAEMRHDGICVIAAHLDTEIAKYTVRK